jgi:glycosyltransferase involved in cell wall biosynthesis
MMPFKSKKKLVMKLLFVSIRDVNKKISGGEKCTNRNYLSFCELLGKENVEVINISHFQEKNPFMLMLRRLSFFRGCYAGLSMRIIKRIVKRSTDFEHVFIDASYLGLISYHLRRSGYRGKIITFFHNVESTIMKQKTRIHPFEFWKFFLVHFNEKLAARHSDTIIALTDRDRKQLQQEYQAASAVVIPISLQDEVSNEDKMNTAIPPTLLFIGDNWYPNVYGLRWFIKNVLDEVDIKLQVVGRNMEKYRKELSAPKIEFLGFVRELAPVIINADYILCPIFTGGGMKVKICEALMYGKNIIATQEALEGYDVDHGEIGMICNDREEFISGIKQRASTPRPRFNAKCREYYLEGYSFQATLGLFKNLLVPGTTSRA